MSRASERIAEGVGEVQGAVIMSVIKGEFERAAFADDVSTKKVFELACRTALKENWMDPPAPAQIVLGSAVAATNAWLVQRDRTADGESLLYEAKVLFALMNDPSRFAELLADVKDPDELVTIGIRPIWMNVCKEEGYSDRTARPL